MIRVFWEKGRDATTLDTMVWRRVAKSLGQEYGLEDYIDIYYRHPAYNNYPVVGVSFKQAVAYCKWRTDRVFEWFLIKKGIIPVNTKQVHDGDVFTVDNYFAGKYMDIKPDFSIPYCEYRLPTKKEWEMLAYGGLDSSKYPYGLDLNRKDIRENLENDSSLFCYLHLTNKLSASEHDSVVHNLEPGIKYQLIHNEFRLYSMHDNVSEMVQEEGVAKGGNFSTKMEESQIKMDFPYDTTKAWLGFRCVAEWKYYKPE